MRKLFILLTLLFCAAARAQIGTFPINALPIGSGQTAQTTGTTLLAYINSVIASGKQLSNQTADPYSGSNPMNTSFGWAAWGGLGQPYKIASNGLAPAMINLFASGPDNGGSPTMQTIGSPYDLVTTSNNIIAAHQMLHLVAEPYNPAHPNANSGGSWRTNPALGSGYFDSHGLINGLSDYNPWSNIGTSSVIDVGSTYYNNQMAQLDYMAAQWAQINGPFIIIMFGETDQIPAQTDWFCNPPSGPLVGGLTPFQVMYEQAWNRIMVTGPYASQIASKALWFFGLGLGDSTTLPNLGNWDPGGMYTDGYAIDNNSDPTYTSAPSIALYNGLQAIGKPVFFSSVGGTAASGNVYSHLASISLTYYPKMFGLAYWGSGSYGLNNTTAADATNSMTGSLLNWSTAAIPAFSRNK